MDSFESVIATILERQGFWTRTSFKVKLEPEEKVAIGRPTTPRWELDVIAYRPDDNVLRIVECKSYLDSRGVSIHGFEEGGTTRGRYKLFNEATTRRVVLSRLVKQLREEGAVALKPKKVLCLAAGKVVASERERLQRLFDRKKWLLFDREWIQAELQKAADDGYDNSIASITAKLLLR